MADELIFDPTLKKKKKKKKVVFGTDEQVVGECIAPKIDDPVPDVASGLKKNGTVPLDVDSLQEGDSKPEKDEDPFSFEELKQTLPEEDKSFVDTEGLEDFDFSITKKKKKKKVSFVELEPVPDIEEPDDAFDDGDVVGVSFDSLTPWSDSDRDYKYDELLSRAFDLLREKNPDIAAGERKRFVMKPPKTLRVGSKKTSFANFLEICRIVHRQPKHVQAFLLAELGTSGSIDGNNQLIIRGRFQQRQIESVLRSYVREYVTCHTCRSPDTVLEKDTRLFFLKCESCGSRCSVTTIKSGFQAVTGKRAALRQKTT